MRNWPKQNEMKLIPTSTRKHRKITGESPRGHMQELVQRFMASGEYIAEIDCPEDRRERVYQSIWPVVYRYKLDGIVRPCHINRHIYLIRVDEAIKHERL